MNFTVKEISEDYFFDSGVVRIVETTDGKFFWQQWDNDADEFIPYMDDITEDQLMFTFDDALRDAEVWFENESIWRTC